MHVPDGVLPLWLVLTMLGISAVFLFASVKMVNRKFDDRLVPYMGVLAAVIFAAQLVNFPVPPFSSGHLVGSALLAIMLGPWAGMLIIALVLFVQALYGDGGILAYGLNFFNMGVLGCFAGWAIAILIFKWLTKVTEEKKSVLVATAISSFFTTIIAAFALGLELLSVEGFTTLALSALVGVHVIIAVGEAILATAVIAYFVKAKPSLISFLKDSDTREVSQVDKFPVSVSAGGSDE
ncbi:MAG: cobalamin biosynthesis protein CbiM [Candidatus Lokiarchaeota archaeon]|nr:cobalamin biosynthesis protein CbiM [Candidatus Lokiarchaeota archaeon]